MTKALKVTMVVYGVIGILYGLTMILIPTQMGEWFNGPTISDPVAVNNLHYLMAASGLANIAAAFFLIMASRDPVKNISWVKFAIVWALFWIVGIVYALARGYVTFDQELGPLIFHVIFAILFFVFYPWRPQTTS